MVDISIKILYFIILKKFIKYQRFMTKIKVIKELKL